MYTDPCSRTMHLLLPLLADSVMIHEFEVKPEEVRSRVCTLTAAHGPCPSHKFEVMPEEVEGRVCTLTPLVDLAPLFRLVWLTLY